MAGTALKEKHNDLVPLSADEKHEGSPSRLWTHRGVSAHPPNGDDRLGVFPWWSVIHGYKHPTLTRAIQDQAGKFCHVMLGGLTHEPVQKLSAKLEQWLPGDLDCCFFSDSGSVAVEVSLKWPRSTT